MKKAIFTALLAVTATASFADTPDLAWNHANDAGPIVGLAQVQQPQGMRFNKEDRTEYTAPSTGVFQDNSYQRMGGTDR